MGKLLSLVRRQNSIGADMSKFEAGTQGIEGYRVDGRTPRSPPGLISQNSALTGGSFGLKVCTQFKKIWMYPNQRL